MPLISLNWRKIAHFWIGNASVPLIEPRMGTNEPPGQPEDFKSCVFKGVQWVNYGFTLDALALTPPTFAVAGLKCKFAVFVDGLLAAAS